VQRKKAWIKKRWEEIRDPPEDTIWVLYGNFFLKKTSHKKRGKESSFHSSASLFSSPSSSLVQAVQFTSRNICVLSSGNASWLFIDGHPFSVFADLRDVVFLDFVASPASDAENEVVE
jgi:hypothetical protein